MEYYFKNYSKKLRTASNNEIANYIIRSINAVITDDLYDRYGKNGYGQFTLNNIKMEAERCLNALTENVKNSSFEPTFFEESFGYGQNRKNFVVETNGEKFNFRGKIDRIDTFNDKIVIIDYKTGNVKSDIEEVYSGSKIQLYLYLKAFTDDGKIPAGVCYLPIKNNYNKNNSNYAMKGQILDDYDTWVEFDNNVKNQEKTLNLEIFNFTLKRKVKGGFTFSNRKNKLSKNDFDIITSYVEKIVKIALNEIMEGYLEKKPYNGKCKYCSYKNMCAQVPQRKKISSKQIEDFKGEKSNE